MGKSKKVFILTDEHIKKAKSYMPLSEKESLAKDIADRCLYGLKTEERNKDGESFMSFPPILSEKLGLKSILLMNVLLSFYFDIELPDPEKEKVDWHKTYDFYMGGHLLNQLERFKQNFELKDKVFDVLSDYKEFKKMVETEIYNRKTNANDVLMRFAAGISLASNPEHIQEMVETLKKESSNYETLLKEKEIVGLKRSVEMKKGLKDK